MTPKARANAGAIHGEARASDAELMGRLGTGDLGALGEIYDRYQEAVRRFVLQATTHRDDADDIVQNTFLTAARAAARFDGRASCGPWLVGIAGRLVQQRGRRLGQVARFVSRIAFWQPPSSDPRPMLEARSALGRTAAALARMTAAKRVVVLMAEVEGMTCPEIAAALEIPVGTVWTRLHAARRELRVAVPEWDVR